VLGRRQRVQLSADRVHGRLNYRGNTWNCESLTQKLIEGAP
jgi:hypothetical protein